MCEQRTGAQIMCEALIREGVDVMFGIPGGAIMPFYHAMWEYRDQLRHVLCRHEQGAGHAAEGYARSTGQSRRLHRAPAAPARPTWSRRSPTRGWTARRWSRSPARSPAPCWARMPSRRPTSPASPCRSPSTTTWSSDVEDLPYVFQRGVSHRLHRPARPGADRCHQGRQQAQHRAELGRDAEPAGLQAELHTATASRSARRSGC